MLGSKFLVCYLGGGWLVGWLVSLGDGYLLCTVDGLI